MLAPIFATTSQSVPLACFLGCASKRLDRSYRIYEGGVTNGSGPGPGELFFDVTGTQDTDNINPFTSLRAEL